MQLHEQKKYEDAIKQYDKISTIDPENLKAQYEKCLSLSISEKKDELKALLGKLHSEGRMLEFPEL